ncbi:MAG: FliM/FliN family flagellar motor switch protein [Deltaproteobacteria bacterium]|nr:FliM/FliN family flagellar motor switch protein [Deltaproteobacteria bacterium]
MNLGTSELELQQFHLLEARFFDQLRQNLSSYLTVPLKLSDVKRGFETFGDFCKGERAQLVFVPVLDSAATLVFRVGDQMAGLIVDAIFTAADKKMPSNQENAETHLSETELRILLQILGAALTTAVEEVFSRVFGGRVTDLIQNVDHAGLLENKLDSGELVLTAEASVILKGRCGDFALGLPFSLISQLHTKESPFSLNSGDIPGSRNVSSLAAVPVEMSAVLAERELSLAEVSRLKLGSVIILQRLRQLPKAQLCAAGQVLFRGTIVENHGWHNFLIQQLETTDVERPAE